MLPEQVRAFRAVEQQNAVVLTWQPPLNASAADLTRYELRIDSEDWITLPLVTTYTVEGLQTWRAYVFRLRAVGVQGVGPESEPLTAIPEPPIPVVEVKKGGVIELLNVNRQSFIVQLGTVQCRLRIFWNPVDRCWYIDLQIPAGTPVISGRRIVPNRCLLNPTLTPLNGTLIARSTVGSDNISEKPWGRTHFLQWTPNE